MRSARAHQPALSVHNVGNQAAAADFMQASNQELQIHDCAHHAEKTPAVADRTAHQHYCTLGLAILHLQRLPVVGTAIASCVIGMLQLALQKGVRSDAAGGNSFGLGIQQSGVSDFVGGRNKVFQ